MDDVIITKCGGVTSVKSVREHSSLRGIALLCVSGRVKIASLCPVAWLEQLPSGSMLKRTCLHWFSAQATASQLHSQDFINCTNTSDVHREQVITV
jgi:hypothetical protein